MPSKESSFREWFEAQFGKQAIPREKWPPLIDAIRDGDRAKMLLSEAREYEALKDAALKAWCARDKEA